MVNRRWFGVIVVVGVMVAAAVGAGPLSRRVAGQPTVVAVSAAPTVGECVTALARPERGTEIKETIDYPTAEYGPCDRPIVGEVSSVDQSTAPARQLTGADFWPLSAQCALDAIGYTGSIPPVVYQGAGRPGMLWTPSISIGHTPVGPNAAQRALGQRWTACVVGSTDTARYVGRLQLALYSGVLPAVFGSCWPASYILSATQIPCGQPHVIEQLGTTLLGTAPVSADDVRAACAEYAGRVLRTADPTRQGAVSLGIAGYDRALTDRPSGATSLRDQTVSCYAEAAAGSQFNDTLVGIGERPLPLVR